MPATTIESYFAAKSDPVGASTAPLTSAPTCPIAKANAPAEASNPLCSSERDKPGRVDLEQQFVDYFLTKAVNPTWRGKKLKGRRVAVFGKKYYWGDDATFDIKYLPQSFHKWCNTNKYTGYNSFLVNVYTELSDNIGWHSDDTTNLKSGEVVSVSFAAKVQDRSKTLANMEFRYPNKKDPSGGRILKKEALKHGTVVRFDAHKHKKKQCEHRVPKTLCARVNVTMRSLN